MPSPQFPKVLARLTERIDVITSRAIGAGLDNIAWPAVVGACAGVLIVSGIPRLGATLHAKYGEGIIVFTFALLALGATTIYARRTKRDDLPWMRVGLVTRRFGAPFLLGPILLALSRGLEKNHPFLVLALSLAGAWVVSVCFRAWVPKTAQLSEASEDSMADAPSKDPTRGRDKWSLGALGFLVSLYAVVFSWLSLHNHWAFNTGRADLGFYVSIFRRSSLGDPLGCTICGGGNHLSGHFDPILVLLSPLYLLYPEAETILVLQSLLLASTMIPLYLLACHHGVARWPALLVCLCFGLHPALHGINLFDFHSLALLVPAALWLLWARDTGRTKTFWVALLITLLVREDAALVLVFVGADTLLMPRKGSAAMGIATMALGALYFVAVKGMLMDNPDPLSPAGGRGYAYYYRELIPQGTGTAGLVTTVLSQPDKVLALIASEEKVLYWLQLLAPLLALPLLAYRGRLLLAYGAAFTLLASREFVYSLHFHYSSVVVPFLFYLTVVALSKPRASTRLLTPLLGRTRLELPTLQLLIAVVALSTTSLSSWRFGAILPNKSFHAGFRPLERKPTERELKRERALKQVCRDVPEGSIVAANEPDLAHLGRCSAYYMKKRRLQADYFVWSATKGSTARAVQREVRAGYWKEVKSYGGLRLFKNVAPKDAELGGPKARSRKKPKRPNAEAKAKAREKARKTLQARKKRASASEDKDGGKP